MAAMLARTCMGKSTVKVPVPVLLYFHCRMAALYEPITQTLTLTFTMILTKLTLTLKTIHTWSCRAHVRNANSDASEHFSFFAATFLLAAVLFMNVISTVLSYKLHKFY